MHHNHISVGCLVRVHITSLFFSCYFPFLVTPILLPPTLDSLSIRKSCISTSLILFNTFSLPSPSISYSSLHLKKICLLPMICFLFCSLFALQVSHIRDTITMDFFLLILILLLHASSMYASIHHGVLLLPSTLVAMLIYKRSIYW